MNRIGGAECLESAKQVILDWLVNNSEFYLSTSDQEIRRKT